MSNDHVIDTPVRLARCNRCKAYVWLAMSSGIRSAADTTPATHAAWIAAIVDGRRTFRLTKAAGKPHKLLCRPLGAQPPVFGPEGVQESTLGLGEVVVEHGCGGHARNMLTFEEIPQEEAKLTCDIWKASGWVPPPGKCERDRGRDVKTCNTCDKPPFDLAQIGLGSPEDLPRLPGDPGAALGASESNHDSGKGQAWQSPTGHAARPGPAPDVRTAPAATKPSRPTESATGTGSAPTVWTGAAPTPQPSALYAGTTASGVARPSSATPRNGLGNSHHPVRCNICDKLINQAEPFSGIHHGRWIWAVHEECD
jgi:hypothetical protein